MSIATPWHHTIQNDPYDVDFSTVDVPIGGKLIQAKLELTNMESMNFKSDDEYKRAIKQKIASDLARAMIETNLIEFTRLPQPATGTDIIYARCYLAPDASVKILRMNYVKPDKR
jgi:hypothetical protein